MVKTVSIYDKDKIKQISKPLATKGLIISSIFSVVIIVLAILMLVKAIQNSDVFNIVMGCIVVVFSGYPVLRTLRQNKEALKSAISEMGIDKGSVTINMLVRDKRIEISQEQNGEVKNSTVLLRNINEVKVNKVAVAIYVKDNVYYVLNDDYIEGTREELLNVIKKAGIKIKGK